MFVGQTGGGKTTLARIIARLLQCRHWTGSQVDVCDICLKKWNEFDITTVQTNTIGGGKKTTGVEEMKQAIVGANYVPRPGSRARVYILDELHRASPEAQGVLLSPMEDCPKTTFWIVCTTETDRILPTIQSRCTKYTVPGLDEVGIRVLVKRGLRKVKSELDSEVLVDQLLEAQVSSPRVILGAVEKYTAGSTPEEAAMQVSTEIDTHAICRSVVSGQWEKVARQLMEAKPEDARSIRYAVAAYLKSILLGETEFNTRVEVVAQGIIELAHNYGIGDSLQVSSLAATLYKLCKTFRSYRR